jgi:DNA-binding transcriptional LysR family regulator
VTALRTFDAVCRAGSVLSAARDLFVTPGAVSRQIKGLEESLGSRLFTRSNARLTLTPFGARYRDHVVPAFDRLESATREARDHSRGGPLTVACLLSFTLLWLVPRLQNFARQYPETELRIVSLHRRDLDWDASELDAVIDVGRWPANQNLIQTSFMMDMPGLVARGDYWNSLGGAADPWAAAARAAFLGTRSRPHLWNSLAESYGQVLPEDRREIWFDHLFLAIAAARAGLGIAPAPRIFVEEDLAAGRLVAPLGFVRKPIPYYVAWPRQRSDDPRLTALVGWLKEEARAGNPS